MGVGTARRLLLGRTELKKLAIVPDIVGLREGMMQKTESKGENLGGGGLPRALFRGLTQKLDNTLMCTILAFSSCKDCAVFSSSP